MTETNKLFQEGLRNCRAYLTEHLQNPNLPTEKDLKDTQEEFFKFYKMFEPVKHEILNEIKLVITVVPGGEANILENENRSKCRYR